MLEKVCVVLASYNGQKYIREQLDSIAAQEGVEVSLLVRDDGSRDATQEILEQYQATGALRWYTGEHLNVAQGFLELLRNAPKADYYAFCDQDDVWLPDKLSAAVAMLKLEDPEIPLMYYCATTLVDEKLDFLMEHPVHENRTDLARFVMNDMSGNTIVMNGKLKEALCAAEKPNISIHDKWCLQVCLALGGKCIGDPKSHILYRQHGKNTIGMELSFGDKVRKFFRVIDTPHDKNLDALLVHYESELVSPYKELIALADGKKLPWKQRRQLAGDKRICFDHRFFDLAWKIRVLRGIL